MEKDYSATEKLRSLKVGETIEVTPERCRSMRTLASMRGFEWDRVFRTRIDRKRRVMTVTRIR